MNVEELKWIGKSKITRLKGATQTYATIRFKDLDNLDKTGQIYKTKIDGQEGYLIIVADEPVQSLNEKFGKVSTNFKSLNYSELEKRITELEKVIKELYSFIPEKQHNNANESSKNWTRRDLNPGPPPREGGALPLSYEPFNGNVTWRSLRIRLIKFY